MLRLVEQLRQVVLLYVSRPRLWLRASWLILFLWPLWITSPGAHMLLLGFSLATLLNISLLEHVKEQFLHHRARLLPGFALPHLSVLIGIIVCASAVLPAVFAMKHGGSVLQWVAVGTFFSVAVFAMYYFPAATTVGTWLILAAIFLPEHFGYSIEYWNFNLPPAISIALILCSLAVTVVFFRRLAVLCEDDDLYQQLEQRAGKLGWKTGHRHQQQRTQVSGIGWAGNRTTDRCLDRLHGFHQYNWRAIVRLLQFGFGAKTNTLLKVSVGLSFSILFFLFFIRPAITDESDSAPLFWVLGVTFASLFPGAKAGAKLSERRPYLTAELMWPLSRRQLVDGLFQASAIEAFMNWTAVNVALLVIVFFLPGLKVTILFAVTCLLLSATMSMTMFGLALFDIKIQSTVERIAILCVVTILCIGVMLAWWNVRSDTGDAPFWIVAAVFGALGWILIENARDTWFNLELG